MSSQTPGSSTPGRGNSRKRAVIWQWFSSPENDHVICNLCSQGGHSQRGTIKYSGSTSSMLNHFKSYHLVEYKEFIEPSVNSKRSSINTESTQRTVSSFFPTVRPLSNDDVASINYQLIYMICTDLQPFSIVEDVGFLRFCHSLNSNYKVPSRNTVAKLLTSMSIKVNTFMKQFIQNSDYIAVTTDIWKSRKNRSYLTLTAHFIIDKHLYDCSLDTLPITNDECAETLAEMIETVFLDWDIKNRIVVMVTDNAANVVAACRNLMIHRVPCMGHLLNLAVSDVFKNDLFKTAFKKCKSIVTDFRKSGPMKLELDRIQLELNPDQPEPLQLLSYTKTRWNSRLYMIKRLIQLQPCLVQFWRLHPEADNLTSSDFSLLKDCVLLLDPISEATTSLSGRKYITLSSVIPIINCSIDAVSQQSPRTSTGKLLKRSLSTALTQRFKTAYNPHCATIDIEADPFLQIATFIDPRFKRQYFDNSDFVELAKEAIANEFSAWSVSSTPSSIGSNSQPRKVSIWDNCKYSSEDDTSGNDLKTLLANYESTPKLPRSVDPLVESSFGKYSGDFARLKRKFLCAPATSVPSESFFSKLEYITGDRRNGISDKRFEQVASLHTNLKVFESEAGKEGIKQLCLST